MFGKRVALKEKKKKMFFLTNFLAILRQQQL